MVYAFLTVLLALAFTASARASITVPTTTSFGCGSGAYISFDEEKTFTSINQTFQTSGWYFGNYGFESTDCNISVTDLFVTNDQKVFLSVSSTSNVEGAMIKFEDGNRNSHPAEVLGSAIWSYDLASNTVTFTSSLTADTDYIMVVSWDASDGGGGGGPQPTPSPAPTPTPSPSPTPFHLPDFTPEDTENIIIIVIIVAAAFVITLIFMSREPEKKKRLKHNGNSPLGRKKTKRGSVL